MLELFAQSTHVGEGELWAHFCEMFRLGGGELCALFLLLFVRMCWIFWHSRLIWGGWNSGGTLTFLHGFGVS